jgi:hypothetical protein
LGLEQTREIRYRHRRGPFPMRRAPVLDPRCARNYTHRSIGV